MKQLHMKNYLKQFPSKTKEYLEASAICARIQQKGFQAVFAGGCVRDILCNVEFNDIDIATNSTPEQVIEILEGYKIKEVGKAFGVVLVEINNFEFEIATFRKDFDCDGRLPGSVEFSSMEEDANRRDFTINAVFYDPITCTIYDYVNGASDILNKRLRFVGNAKDRLREDYLRVLRFVRFYQKGFAPLEEDVELVNMVACLTVTRIASERIILELKKIMKSDNFLDTLKPFFNLYVSIFGTNPSAFDFYGKVKPSTFESLVALFFYCSMSPIENFNYWAKKYNISNQEKYNIEGIIKNKSIFFYDGLDRATIHKLTKESFFNDLLALVEYVADPVQWCQYKLYKPLIEELREIPLPDKIITGDVLIDLGFKPSKEFSKFIKDMYNNQLNGKFKTLEKGLDILRKNIYNRFIEKVAIDTGIPVSYLKNSKED